MRALINNFDPEIRCAQCGGVLYYPQYIGYGSHPEVLKSCDKFLGDSEMEEFELVGKDKKAYFENDDDIEVRPSDRVVIALHHAKKVATWVVVPEGGDLSNYVSEEDDYDGVINWLIEHDYESPELTKARRDQLGVA